MPDTDSLWSQFDLSRTKSSLLKLEQDCVCSGCHDLPPKPRPNSDNSSSCLVYIVETCGHRLCTSCVSKATGRCPATKCGNSMTKKSLMKDEGMASRIEAIWTLKDLLFTNGVRKNKETTNPIFEEKDERLTTTRQLTGNDENKDKVDQQLTGNDKNEDNVGRQLTGNDEADDNVEQMPPPKPKRSTRKSNPPQIKTKVVKEDSKSSKEKASPKVVKSESKKSKSRKNSNENQNTNRNEASKANLAAAANNESKRSRNNLNPANLNKKNQKGETPLHAACCKNDLDLVRKLLALGAEANTQDYSGWTPLHEAAQRSALEIVSLLLEHGANPNVPGGDDNFSPLHDAVTVGSVAVAKILVEKGASKTSKDSKGRTPINHCLTEEMRKVLEETDCELTDSEQLNLSIRPTNLSNEKVVTVLPSVNIEQLEKMKKLSKQLRFKLEPKIFSKTTHLIVPANEDKVAPNDPAYYEALLSGMWIVSSEWIDKSAESGDLIDEEEFMIVGTRGNRNGGPEKSRTNDLKQLPRLFKGFNIFLEGQFGAPYPTSQELAKILKSGGANILTRKPDPEAIPENEISIPYHALSSSTLSRCCHLIIYQEGGAKEPELKYNMSHVKSLPAAWLFECINNFEIVEEFS